MRSVVNLRLRNLDVAVRLEDDVSWIEIRCLAKVNLLTNNGSCFIRHHAILAMPHRVLLSR